MKARERDYFYNFFHQFGQEYSYVSHLTLEKNSLSGWREMFVFVFKDGDKARRIEPIIHFSQ